MDIRFCIPHQGDYSDCENLLNELSTYKGPHKFEVAYCEGTNAFDVRNVFITNKLEFDYNNPPILPFDAWFFCDSDIKGTLKHVLNLIESGKSNCGCAYVERGGEKYNAGWLTSSEVIKAEKSQKGFHIVDGQGMGFRFIKREVFESISPYWFYPKQKNENGVLKSISEDWNFDLKAKESGFDSWCDFDNPVIHNYEREKNIMQNSMKKPTTDSHMRELSFRLSEVQRISDNLAESSDNHLALYQEAVSKLKKLEDEYKELEIKYNNLLSTEKQAKGIA